ncbi:hypothetical protein A4D02_07855 [Niastella koreensis]|uniref:Lipocalin-like domain-containing protein n=2 Tax=Niastella koreensis TaxID=354356 RepID=G8TL70_NIAKG|nr:lipocalin family protein [Niastella koreensis]AEW01911.1 hypothetical protein Niako_5679 [Niastella koreensis GR20-10]OQP48612.1 hypothetical protein A4D02_07855 [Niastella koreensis]
MKRTFTKFLVLALLAVTSFTACKKSSNDVLTVTKDNLAATYTIISVKAKAPNTPEQDVTSSNFDACEMDDQIILKNDFTATYVDAGTQCSPVGGGSDVWAYNNGILTIAGEDFTVKSLTRGTLVLEQTANISGFVVTVTSTYRRY